MQKRRRERTWNIRINDKYENEYKNEYKPNTRTQEPSQGQMQDYELGVCMRLLPLYIRTHTQEKRQKVSK